MSCYYPSWKHSHNALAPYTLLEIDVFSLFVAVKQSVAPTNSSTVAPLESAVARTPPETPPPPPRGSSRDLWAVHYNHWGVFWNHGINKHAVFGNGRGCSTHLLLSSLCLVYVNQQPRFVNKTHAHAHTGSHKPYPITRITDIQSNFNHVR